MAPRQLPMASGTLNDPGTGVTLLAFVIDRASVHHDSGALHGTSSVEADITFSEDTAAAPDGRPVTVVWIGVRAGIDGRDGYFSAVASTQRIDDVSGTGYRPPTHFTDMIRAIQGDAALDTLSSELKRALAQAMIEYNAEMWAHRSVSLQNLASE